MAKGDQQQSQAGNFAQGMGKFANRLGGFGQQMGQFGNRMGNPGFGGGIAGGFGNRMGNPGGFNMPSPIDGGGPQYGVGGFGGDGKYYDFGMKRPPFGGILGGVKQPAMAPDGWGGQISREESIRRRQSGQIS